MRDLAIIAVSLIVFALVWSFWQAYEATVPGVPGPTPRILVPKNENPPSACTLDAKICPDGSAVGRTGPNCEFQKCPGE